jgi:hypothetical protein
MMAGDAAEAYNALAKGFHIRGAEFSQDEVGRLLRGSEPWEVLAGIALSCQSGNFAPLASVPSLLRRHDGFRFWKAAMELVGCAGTWAFIERVFQEFQGEMDDNTVQYFLAIALGNSCGLWAAEPLLALHARALDEESRYQLERHLSYLLEEDNDTIWIGAEETTELIQAEEVENNTLRTIVDYEGFAAEVRQVRTELVDRLGSDDVAVYEGRILDVGTLARRLYERLTSQDRAKGRIYRERWMFEAMTGVDCSDFFDDENNPRYLPAAAVMESFLERGDTSRYQPGQRYFFGHPIPR